MSFLATIFGRDVLSHDLADAHANHSLQHLRVGSHTFNISTEILDLLWFGDGRRKNTEEFEGDSISEPSEIMTRSQVYKEDIDNVGNYPEFRNLTPGQKYRFLTWLEDIEQKEDIGFAYLLLYALERRICMGSMVEPAVNLICKLHQQIEDEEFVRQSSDALVWAAYKYKRVEFLNCLKLDSMPDETQTLVKLYTHGHLNGHDIMLISEKIGLDDQRYVTGKPRLFEKILNDKLAKKYEEGNFSIKHIDHAGKCNVNVLLSNFSLPKDERKIKVPNLLENKNVRKPLLKMLEETSEAVKIELVGHYKSYYS
ncbi:TerB N-terminal domain-containing protein [Companilactobacillus sp.]|jgi:hypothetical protein|uniref:TerB N-terminal domain-containing protein n=1 Tax=Companilactobacillus sp. TaxID=2767905 RepID=UPI0025BA9C0F|nr:TerB N-terminal domain-containing protein [Companilactobacillus sp.]MCH4009769.1 TerB N-terminal domain-containing protein [Companilactobacillus sp.]MCH4052555.1 TerB N-terminal domain-containing protein [Companilactobacillus sp.]MCH4077711.1 TerB N-terminal domain-containing protein [Companilactobacillus sp.]MCH4126287.1 TerB N-terminal domain-containing protein [Companilactobacillus sp.]MCI1311995.1 TerB N-terminal domain-containing protein [Companilactobacillus sp.]